MSRKKLALELVGIYFLFTRLDKSDPAGVDRRLMRQLEICIYARGAPLFFSRATPECANRYLIKTLHESSLLAKGPRAFLPIRTLALSTRENRFSMDRAELIDSCSQISGYIYLPFSRKINLFFCHALEVAI